MVSSDDSAHAHQHDVPANRARSAHLREQLCTTGLSSSGVCGGRRCVTTVFGLIPVASGALRADLVEHGADGFKAHSLSLVGIGDLWRQRILEVLGRCDQRREAVLQDVQFPERLQVWSARKCQTIRFVHPPHRLEVWLVGPHDVTKLVLRRVAHCEELIKSLQNAPRPSRSEQRYARDAEDLRRVGGLDAHHRTINHRAGPQLAQKPHNPRQHQFQRNADGFEDAFHYRGPLQPEFPLERLSGAK
mmetsp:Transcript_112986/g.319598  ORF Transcript_112986/g.319598 Transcript_112986/m.319598 type:complete len:246 (-) Transcript_112986:324-1061(-)